VTDRSICADCGTETVAGSCPNPHCPGRQDQRDPEVPLVAEGPHHPHAIRGTDELHAIHADLLAVRDRMHQATFEHDLGPYLESARGAVVCALHELEHMATMADEGRRAAEARGLARRAEG
jgi:hypothetical protein